jgi:hypothetical protein
MVLGFSSAELPEVLCCLGDNICEEFEFDAT